MAGSSKITGLDDFAKIGKELYSSSEEHPTPLFAKITGKIPDWFEGTLIRVGPGELPFIVSIRLKYNAQSKISVIIVIEDSVTSAPQICASLRHKDTKE